MRFGPASTKPMPIRIVWSARSSCGANPLAIAAGPGPCGIVIGDCDKAVREPSSTPPVAAPANLMKRRRVRGSDCMAKSFWNRKGSRMPSSSPNLLPQRSLQRDLRNAGKCLRQGAVALRRGRDLLELRLVDAGHRGLQRQRNAVDHEAVALLGQAHAGLGVDVGGCQPGLIAGERKRHGETRGVGGAEDFLWVGAAPVVLEAARKAVGVVLQRIGLGAYLALALLALAFPVHNCGLFGHDVAPVSVWVEGVTNFATLVQRFRYARLSSLYEIELEWRSS